MGRDAIAGVLSILYGTASALAAIGMARGRGKVPVRAAGAFGLAGGILVAGGALLIGSVDEGKIAIVVALVALILLALYNGIKLHGKVNPLHLTIRVLLSLAILGLSFST